MRALYAGLWSAGGGPRRCCCKKRAEDLAEVEGERLRQQRTRRWPARPLAGELFLILSEFFNNALDHGLLRLDSRLKSGPDGMGAYLEARAESLSALQAGEIEIRVDMAESPAGPQLRIRCRDTGPGFDHASRIAAGDLGDGESPSEFQFGRGLALVGNMCREVRFNPAGNEVDAVLVLNRSA